MQITELTQTVAERLTNMGIPASCDVINGIMQVSADEENPRLPNMSELIISIEPCPMRERVMSVDVVLAEHDMSDEGGCSTVLAERLYDAEGNLYLTAHDIASLYARIVSVIGCDEHVRKF